MQKHKFFHFLFFMLAIFLIAGCGQNPWSKDPKYYYVDITGMDNVFNFTTSYAHFGTMSTEENDTLTIAVSEGDMLILNIDEGIYYRYNPADGLFLSFSIDTIYGAYYLNSDIHSISLYEESIAWEWIEQSEAEVFNSLRSLYIELPLSETQINSLKKISDVNSNIALYIEGDTLIQSVLSLFTPDWIIAEDLGFYNLSEEAKSNLKKLELVILFDYDSTYIEFLYDLPGLNSLIIGNWDSVAISEFQFDKIKRLRSLSIIGSDIYDLSTLGTLPKLKDLNLIDCETLDEIGTLVDFTGLKSIGFTACTNIGDISIIKELPSLSRLSLPANTTQEEFSDIVDKQNSLQVLELVLVEDIGDLSPLEDYSGLKALSLDTGFTDFTPLYQMKDLELLVLGGGYYEDSISIAELQNALPETKIVPGGGLCLGSGWILLLIPIITLLLIFKTRYKKYSLARANEI